MDAHIKKVYVPMTETGFYILLCLRTPNHGYGIVQYEKEADFLRQEHKNGWKLSKISGIGVYEFEACEPEDVVYQLDYCQAGNGDKAEYIKMFEDCGWEYLQDFVGYSYFRKPASETSGAEEIFCDDSSRLQMMDRVFKGRVLPLVILFSCVLIPCLIREVYVGEYANIVLLVAVIIVYLWIFIHFAIQYSKFKKKK